MKVKLIVPPGLPIPELSRCPPSCLNSGAKDYQKTSPELSLESGGRDLPKLLKGLTTIKVGASIGKLELASLFLPLPIYLSASVPSTQFIVAAGSYGIQQGNTMVYIARYISLNLTMIHKTEEIKVINLSSSGRIYA